MTSVDEVSAILNTTVAPVHGKSAPEWGKFTPDLRRCRGDNAKLVHNRSDADGNNKIQDQLG